MAQRAESAQDGSCQTADQGAVAIGKGGQARMCIFAGQEVVQSYAPPQNPVEKIGGNSSSGEAGNFRLWGSARTRHTRIVAAKLCPRRETSAKIINNAQLWVKNPHSCGSARINGASSPRFRRLFVLPVVDQVIDHGRVGQC